MYCRLFLSKSVDLSLRGNYRIMKRRVYFLLTHISLIAIVLSLLTVSFIFYKGFEKQIFNDLEIIAHLYSDLNLETINNIEDDTFLKNNIRVSVIDKEGTVIYDNNASIGRMDNHLGREEIKEALENGSGMAVRRSDTLEKSLFYYALRIDNGGTIRVARETNNIISIFLQYMPVFIIMVLLLFLLCTVVARYFTRKLIAPIERMATNLNQREKIETYSELTPFINMIYEQHEDIIKSARMRQDFTANVSHELKTPLTAISGYSELIENGMATEENTRRFAGEIHKSATRLLTLINDIIRLSELDATDVSHTFENIQLNQVTETCVNMLQMNAEKHHVQISYTGEPCQVFATKEMMEELVYNLCDNAIRYNIDGGKVFVSAKKAGNGVLLTVRDTGIGIPEKHQERIFERFYRVDKSRSKSTGGTGLGLAIVKHIVAQCGADMKLESEPGKGTEISIVFPPQAGV